MTPRMHSAKRLQPRDLGRPLGDDFSRADTAKPHMKSTTPKRTNQTVAPAIGSFPTVLNTPRWMIEARALWKTTMANKVCTADTAINQRPIHCFIGISKRGITKIILIYVIIPAPGSENLLASAFTLAKGRVLSPRGPPCGRPFGKYTRLPGTMCLAWPFRLFPELRLAKVDPVYEPLRLPR